MVCDVRAGYHDTGSERGAISCPFEKNSRGVAGPVCDLLPLVAVRRPVGHAKDGFTCRVK
jgi:hypothetical protein